MKNIIALSTAWLGATLALGGGAALAGSPVPLGAYTGGSGVSNGSAFQTFQGYFPGVPTHYYTVYQDYSDDAGAHWGTYAAYIITQMNVTGLNPASGTIPQVGWAMGTAANGNLFNALAAGTYDSQITSFIQQFAAAGYKQIVIRLGWEANIPTIPSQNVTSANVAAYVSGWQHAASVMHAAGTTYGIQVLMNWCPSRGIDQNDGSVTVAQQYPGDTAVDQLGIDEYDAPIDGTLPGTAGSATDWELPSMIAMAKAHNKPFTIGEMGITTTGYANNLVSTLLASQPWTSSAYMAALDFWDVDADGTYLFAHYPSVVSILQAAFGASGTVQNPTGAGGGGGGGGTASVSGTVSTTPGVNLVDASGNTWSFNSAGQIVVNGVADTGTSLVTKIAILNSVFWQQAWQSNWYSKTSPVAAWSAGTLTDPIQASADKATVTTVGPLIDDATADSWSINSAGQVVLNSVADTGTSSVVELAYVSGTLWQKNSSGVWYGKTAPTAAWLPTGGTTASPLFTPSPNGTVVTTVGPAITDANGALWTLTSGGQVALNGTPVSGTNTANWLGYFSGAVSYGKSAEEYFTFNGTGVVISGPTLTYP